MNGNKAGVIAGMVGVGVGTALMFWLDPAAGKRRRAQARHTAKRSVRRVQRVIEPPLTAWTSWPA